MSEYTQTLDNAIESIISEIGDTPIKVTTAEITDTLVNEWNFKRDKINRQKVGQALRRLGGIHHRERSGKGFLRCWLFNNTPSAGTNKT